MYSAAFGSRKGSEKKSTQVKMKEKLSSKYPRHATAQKRRQ